MNEEDELDPIEKELKEAQEQYDAENQRSTMKLLKVMKRYVEKALKMMMNS